MNIKTKSSTPDHVARMVSDILAVFECIGIPVDGTDRALERMAKACLATGRIHTSLQEACSVKDGEYLRTRDIIEFENLYYGESISLSSYDDIRRKDLKYLIEAGIVLSSSLSSSQATNNPSRGYALSDDFATLLHAQGTDSWPEKLDTFRLNHISLRQEISRTRELGKINVKLPDGTQTLLSAGAHNLLQKAIIEDFLPRFGFGASLLYLGDTDKKLLYEDRDELERLRVFKLSHEELPDIIAYSAEKNLLFLIEAYHSTGEWNEIRLRRVKRKLQQSGCSAQTVFFTAFETKDDFKKKAKDIAWETEVWIAANPDHLVHFNGYKFLEIY